MPPDLSEQIAAVIRTKKLFRDGQKIVVAVSGGIDSMVLLALLHRLAGVQRWQLVVAHFNHQLRGHAANADEQLVRETARALGWPAVCAGEPVKQYARSRCCSIEMAARELRHQFLAQAARQHSATSVALAHHADDQVETFFLRLLRGAGSRGLSGMNWTAPSPADKSITLVRPLLDLPKSDLVEYARQHALPFSEDATNASRDILRNRLRHHLLPLLRQEYQPALARCVLRIMDITRSEDALVQECGTQWLTRRRRKPFARLPVAVQRHLIQRQLHELGQPAGFDLVEALRTHLGHPVTADSGCRLVLNAEGRLSPQPLEKISFASESLRLSLRGRSGATEFSQVKISWKTTAQTNENPMPRPGTEHFDAAKLGAKICLRHWQPGDRFHPIGGAGPAKLQDLFTNLKVPRAERHGRVVATTSRGELFWVEGLRIGEKFKLEKSTIRRLSWSWCRE